MTRQNIYVKDAVTELVRKAKDARDANDALKFSQAACNVAQARNAMYAVLEDLNDAG